MLIYLFASIYFFSALACARGTSEGKETVRMVINHYKVPCVGISSQLCYLFKEGNQSEWEFLYEGIEGFQFEWGKVYELEVEKTKRKNPMADQSAVEYRLIKIISSKNAPTDESFPLTIKDTEMIALVKDVQGAYSLLDDYPVRCASPGLCADLENALQSSGNITGLFQHASDYQSLILQSLKN